MRKTLLASCISTMISFCASAQTTYLADTAFTTDVGYGGAPASCLAPHIRYLGWQMGRAQDTWLADVFTVSTDSTWVFDTVIVYGIQENSGTTSTFQSCNLLIYSGTPGGLASSVVWGDTSTNVLTNTGFTGIYKVDTVSSIGGLLNTSYPIMYLKLYLSPAPVLSAGTYWLSWSAAGSLSAIPFSPDKVLPGRINPSGQMARQLYGGVWDYITDSSNNIGMNMIIKASAGLTSSVTNIQGQTMPVLSQNTPNPFNNMTDISYYLPEAGPVKLLVYNVIGQLVAMLTDGNMSAGKHDVTFNANDLPDGTYYYKLITSSGSASRPMVLIR